jgi:hypothetical protein
MVSGFVKRLARLSLVSSPGSCLLIIAFIHNLLALHPSCRSLVHRAVESKSGLLLGVASQLYADPYRPDEVDPAKSHAIDSSLWELNVTVANRWRASFNTFVGADGPQQSSSEPICKDFRERFHQEEALRAGRFPERIVRAHVRGKHSSSRKDARRGAEHSPNTQRCFSQRELRICVQFADERNAINAMNAINANERRKEEKKNSV